MDNYDTNEDDSNYINTKKVNKASEGKTWQNIAIDFVKNTLIKICYLLIYLCIGIFLIFYGKLAQSNILPCDIDVTPYNESVHIHMNNINRIPVDYESSSNTAYMLLFPYNKYGNNNNILIHSINQLNSSSKSSVLIKFIQEFLKNVICTNYSTFQIIFMYMNYYLPQIVILWIGPIMFSILFIFIIIWSIIYFTYSYFTNLGWFWKKYDEPLNKWKSLNSLSWISLFIRTCMIGGLILFFILFFPIFNIFSFLLLIYIFLSSIFYFAEEKRSNDYQKINFLDFLKYRFLYHKSIIKLVISIIATISAYQSGGIGFAFAAAIISLISAIITGLHGGKINNEIHRQNVDIKNDLQIAYPYYSINNNSQSIGGASNKKYNLKDSLQFIYNFTNS